MESNKFNTGLVPDKNTWLSRSNRVFSFYNLSTILVYRMV